MAGGDVEKDEFIGAILVVFCGHFDWAASIFQIDEAGAFDHSAAIDIEARNDAMFEHARLCPRELEGGPTFKRAHCRSR